MREGYCSRPVCVCVCPSVPTLAASASVETSKQRYSRVSLRLFLDLYVGVPKKPSFQKLWRGKANMQMSWSSPSAAFGTGLETDHVRPFNAYLSRDALLVVREGAKIGLAEKRFTCMNWTFCRHTRRPWGPRYLQTP